MNILSTRAPRLTACRRALLCVLFLFGGLNAYADDWEYTIRPGDDLWTLTKEFCGSARHADAIASYNNLPNPAAVRAGRRIKFPTNMLVFAPAKATIIQVRGDVNLLLGAGRSATTQPARLNTELDMGVSLITNDGAALVSFADGSTLSIEPNSRVLFNKLTAFGPAGMVDTHLRFAYGRGTSQVQPQSRGDLFRIETPEGIAAVRGTIFRVGYAATLGLANTETLEGEVAFVQSQNTTPVPEGYGVAATATGVTKEELLPPPQLIQATDSIGQQGRITWQPVPGAARYVTSFYLSDQPNVVVQSKRASETSTLVDLSPGTYLFTVRGVSAAGIEGQDRQHTLRVLGAPPTPLDSTLVTTEGGSGVAWNYAGTGPYQLTVTNLATQVRSSFTATDAQLNLDLPPGEYEWIVSTSSSAPSQPATLTVLPPAPANLTVEKIDRSTLTVQLSWDQVASADAYTLELRLPGVTPKTVTTNETRVSVPLEDFGKYTVSLASQSNSLQSASTEKEVLVQRRPWWLLLLAIPALVI